MKTRILIALLALVVGTQGQTKFSDFTTSTAPAAGDYFVGFLSGGGASSNRKWTWTNLHKAPAGSTVDFSAATTLIGTSTGTSLTATGVLHAYSGTAIPAGGTTGYGVRLSSTANLGMFFGSGAPTLSAAQGSLYLRSDGAPYYNTNGSTAWTAIGGSFDSAANYTLTGTWDFTGAAVNFGTLGVTTLNATAFNLNGGATPTVATFGDFSSDNNLWATGHGTLIFHDGTSSTALVNVLTSDTPTNGQVPTWNTGGTITWESPTPPALTSTQIAYGSGGNIATGEAAFTYDATTNRIGVDSIQLGTAGVTITQDGDGAITFLGAGNGTDEDLTLNFDDVANTVGISSSTGVATMDFGSIGLVTTGTNAIGGLVDAVDGTTPLNNVVQTVATGTAYTLTTSYADVDFGTTDPTVTIPNAGTYTVFVTVQTSLVAATTTNQSASFKLRRTNNTAADLTGSTFGQPFPVATAGTQLGAALTIGPIKYTTTNTNDVLTVQGILSGALGAGTVTVTNVTITAERKY